MPDCAVARSSERQLFVRDNRDCFAIYRSPVQCRHISRIQPSDISVLGEMRRTGDEVTDECGEPHGSEVVGVFAGTYLFRDLNFA